MWIGEYVVVLGLFWSCMMVVVVVMIVMMLVMFVVGVGVSNVWMLALEFLAFGFWLLALEFFEF